MLIQTPRVIAPAEVEHFLDKQFAYINKREKLFFQIFIKLHA